ncbi:MAG: ATP-binding protein [Trebonia sp.]
MASLRHFIGRERDIARLQRHLDAVVGEGQGRLLSIRGRRQAGKSRLVTEFADRTGLPQPARRSSSWMSSLGCADPARTLRVHCKSPGTGPSSTGRCCLSSSGQTSP